MTKFRPDCPQIISPQIPWTGVELGLHDIDARKRLRSWVIRKNLGGSRTHDTAPQLQEKCRAECRDFRRRASDYFGFLCAEAARLVPKLRAGARRAARRAARPSLLGGGLNELPAPGTGAPSEKGRKRRAKPVPFRWHVLRLWCISYVLCALDVDRCTLGTWF
jgi:hypothetical protein